MKLYLKILSKKKIDSLICDIIQRLVVIKGRVIIKKYLVIILIIFHLVGNSLYASKTFLKKDHTHSYIDRYHLHEHHHSHNGYNHQHKHSHAQINMIFLDFFTDMQHISLYDFSNSPQRYLETFAWIPNPTLQSLFRPPKI